jgi:hypothetical protein
MTAGYPSEEPIAGKPHDGICGGESQQWLSYPTFVQNRTLSGQGPEHRTNLPQWPKRRGGIRLGPDVVAGQTDVLPSERGLVAEIRLNVQF